MKYELGCTKNNIKVFDRKNSHFHAEGGLSSELFRNALQQIEFGPDETFGKYTVKFDHMIGKTNCVSVNDSDEIVMVKRIGRDGFTPMVKNRTAEDSDSITIILFRPDGCDDAILVAAYIGESTEREPWDKAINSEEELQRCIKYWNSHALVYDESLIEKET